MSTQVHENRAFYFGQRAGFEITKSDAHLTCDVREKEDVDRGKILCSTTRSTIFQIHEGVRVVDL